MQAQTTAKAKQIRAIQCEVVESDVPGEYVVEIIHYCDEGKVSTVRFLSQESKKLAEEYASWKSTQS